MSPQMCQCVYVVTLTCLTPSNNALSATSVKAGVWLISLRHTYDHYNHADMGCMDSGPPFTSTPMNYCIVIFVHLIKINSWHMHWLSVVA